MRKSLIFWRFLSVRGNGDFKGRVGGGSRYGQLDNFFCLFVTAELVEFWLSEFSPIVWNVSKIIFNATQASLLRNNLSELSVKSVSCLVSTGRPCLFVPWRSIMASRMLMPLLFAACIFIVTGIRSDLLNPNLWSTFMPARQLWQPVSAMAGKDAAVGGESKVKPKAA